MELQQSNIYLHNRTPVHAFRPKAASTDLNMLDTNNVYEAIKQEAPDSKYNT